MPREQIEFTGIMIKETDKARLLVSGTHAELWVPKSAFTYFCKVAPAAGYGSGGSWHIKFKVEPWKVSEVQAAMFDES